MTTPNQRSMWWEERVHQEEKSLVKLIKACKHRARRASGGDAGPDAEQRARRHELARKMHATEKELASERVARFKADAEALELSAMVEKIDERLMDPAVVNAKKSSGAAVAASLH